MDTRTYRRSESAGELDWTEMIASSSWSDAEKEAWAKATKELEAACK